jgi:hypothetical protein
MDTLGSLERTRGSARFDAYQRSAVWALFNQLMDNGRCAHPTTSTTCNAPVRRLSIPFHEMAWFWWCCRRSCRVPIAEAFQRAVMCAPYQDELTYLRQTDGSVAALPAWYWFGQGARRQPPTSFRSDILDTISDIRRAWLIEPMH